jgi:hypothetical protein
VRAAGCEPSGSVARVSGTNGGAPGWVWNGTGWVWVGEAPPQYPTAVPAAPQPPGATNNPYVIGAVGPYVPPTPGPQQQLPVPPAAQRATNRSGCLGLLVAAGAGLLLLASLIWSVVAFAVHVW